MEGFIQAITELEVTNTYNWLTYDWFKGEQPEIGALNDKLLSKVDQLAKLLYIHKDVASIKNSTDAFNQLATKISEDLSTQSITNINSYRFKRLVEMMHLRKSEDAKECNIFFTSLINKIYFPCLSIDIYENIINQIDDIYAIKNMAKVSKSSYPFARTALILNMNSTKPPLAYNVVTKRLDTNEIRKLTSLNLKNTKLSDDQLANLKVIYPHIEYLNLNSCRDITNKGIEYLKEFSSLTHLDLGSCSDLSEIGLAQLTSLSKIEILNLTHWRFTDIGLHHLKNLINLKDLDFSGVVIRGKAQLGKLTKLEKLILDNCTITSDKKISLNKLINLKTLNLKLCKGFSNEDIVRLSSLSKLENLNLYSCELENNDLAQLSVLNLKVLDLSVCSKLTDNGIESLSRMTTLENLNLSLCAKLSDQGLFHLKGLQNLKKLELIRLGLITRRSLTDVICKISSLEYLDLMHCSQLEENTLSNLTELKNLKFLQLKGNISEATIKLFTSLDVKVSILTPQGHWLNY